MLEKVIKHQAPKVERLSGPNQEQQGGQRLGNMSNVSARKQIIDNNFMKHGIPGRQNIETNISIPGPR